MVQQLRPKFSRGKILAANVFFPDVVFSDVLSKWLSFLIQDNDYINDHTSQQGVYSLITYPYQIKAYNGIHKSRNGLPFLVTGLLSIIRDISISVNTGDNRSLTSNWELSVTELHSSLYLLLKPENKGR